MAVAQSPAILLWGEGKGTDEPKYWQAAPVASDDSVDITFVYEGNPATPQGLGGECVFVAVYLTVKAAAGATLSATPIIDDTEPAALSTTDSGTVSTVAPTVTIPQQAGGPPVPMVTTTYEIPLLLKLVRASVTQSRWYPRGGRCALRITNTGPIGAGSFHLDGLELEYQPIRAVSKGTVVTT